MAANSLGVCQVCGKEAETKSVSLYKQTAMVIMRQTNKISGHLCKSCINSNGLSYTGWNLALGWWGVISCICNPFYILNNVVTMGLSLGMVAPPPNGGPPQLTDQEAERIADQLPMINEMFQQKKKMPEVAAAVAGRAGVRPAQVVAFIQALARQNRQ